jgi:hypothetical protein
MPSRLLVHLPLLLSLLAVPALAADPPLAAHAPRWAVGDWWVVAVHTPRRPGPGFTLAHAQPLAGLPPVKGGPHTGWIESSRWRFEVLRQAIVDKTPHWILRAQRRGHKRSRIELWVNARDATLERLVLRPQGPRTRTHRLRGRAQHADPLAVLLGLPLEWPDVSGGPVERDLRLGNGKKLVQSHITRAQVTTVDLWEGERQVASFRFAPGLPWWRSVRTDDLRARLVAHGHKTSKTAPPK